MINFKIIGKQTIVDSLDDIEKFIDQYKQLITELIRSIRDQLLDYLLNEIMNIVGDLAKEIALKLSVEQAMYYSRLMKKLINCFRIHGKTLDFVLDDVQYADIMQFEEEPLNKEC